MPRSSEYQTKQRTQILEYLAEHGSTHMTAAELLIALNTSGTPIGSATVYRQLEKLEAQGLVRRYTLDDRGSACWQYAGEESEHGSCHQHFHLKCTACNRLFHLNCEHLQEIQSHVSAEHDFAIDPSRTVFYGVCGSCRSTDVTQTK